jgi:hypothetical protein
MQEEIVPLFAVLLCQPDALIKGAGPRTSVVTDCILFRTNVSKDYIRKNEKKCVQKRKGDTMKQQVMMIIALLLLLSLFAGCVYVNPLVQVGEKKGTPDQDIAIKVCEISCENHIRYLPLGCICPETTTSIPVNITPASAGK